MQFGRSSTQRTVNQTGPCGFALACATSRGGSGLAGAGASASRGAMIWFSKFARSVLLESPVKPCSPLMSTA